MIDSTDTDIAKTWIDKALAVLREANPEWECWHVPCVVDPDRWCARRREAHDDKVSTDDGPDRLQEMIDSWEKARDGTA